jgi:hypothetical protein
MGGLEPLCLAALAPQSNIKCTTGNWGGPSRLFSRKSNHRKGTNNREPDLCSPGKLPVFRRHFDLFPFFNERGNANFQAGLEPG